MANKNTCKVSIMYGEDLYKATWQNKSFADEMAALQFVRMHAEKVWGINGNIFLGNSARILTHFEIMDALRDK